MTIVRAVAALPVRLSRDLEAATGSAGSPARLVTLATPRRYRRAATYGTVYSSAIETTLVRVETDDGRVGWGEAQAPVVPEASAAIVEHLLGPMLVGEPLPEPETWWDVMYDAMRVRGHHGGFYVDAMAGVDLALWDLAGQRHGAPVCRLLSDAPRASVPVYVSGLAGGTVDEKVAAARQHAAAGARAFKVFLDDTSDALVATIDRLRAELDPATTLMVDALWRLTLDEACSLAEALAARRVAWLEAPLAPEDVIGHAALARCSAVPIALGENLRTTFEVQPFLEAGAVQVLQPDLGRTGITGARRIAALATASGLAVAPHVSIGLGPQIAAAAHVSAATLSVTWLEANPLVYEMAQRFQTNRWSWDVQRVELPAAPGLGCAVDERALAQAMAQHPSGGTRL